MTDVLVCLPAATWCPPSAPSPLPPVTAEGGAPHGCLAARSPHHKPLSIHLVGPEQLQLWFQTHARQQPASQTSPGAGTTLARSSAGWMRRQPTYEATRCYSCGNCFECVTVAMAALPLSRPIAKLGPGLGYQVDAERCTGCGACHECPLSRHRAAPTGGSLMKHELTRSTAIEPRRVAYQLSEVCTHLPHHPELDHGRTGRDAWAAQGRPTWLGNIPSGGRCRVKGQPVHGALQAGHSPPPSPPVRGLMLMLPNMYKDRGELTSTGVPCGGPIAGGAGLSILATIRM